MKAPILTLLSLILLGGCSDNSKPDPQPAPDGASYSKSFIQTFLFPEAISLEGAFDKQLIVIYFEGREVGRIGDSERTEFDALCTRYGDTSYNRNTVPGSPKVIAGDWVSADIVCNRAIGNHAAGESLGTLVKLCGKSPAGYIRSGYNPDFQGSRYPSEFVSPQPSDDRRYDSVYKSLSELTPDDLALLEANSILLYLPELPEKGTCEFTMTVRLKDKTLTAKLTADIR